MQAPQAPSQSAEYLTPAELAELLRLREWTVRRWRKLGIGPCYVRLDSGTILYPRDEVERYLAEHLRGTA
jgi:predicted site-specific integrase-resolvase